MDEKDLVKLVENNLKKFSTTDAFINIYLVYKGARKACFLFLLHKEIIPEIISLVDKLELVFVFGEKGGHLLKNTTDDTFFVAKPEILKEYLNELTGEKNHDDMILGKYLGFLCFDHIYNKPFTPRIGINISIVYKGRLVGDYAYVCETEKVDRKEPDFDDIKKDAENKVKEWQKILPFKIFYEIEKMEELTD